MLKREIKKKEINNVIAGILIGGGTFFLIFPIRDILASKLNTGPQMVIGGLIILAGLWFFDLV